ncbi:MAG: flagellar basal body rod protein FlgB [Chromatiales bacterium]|jgi:flagellar basal-body rod protein FlgB|nr:flagellar basal body rod protein FlgB [Chromatiales bacterium]
MTSKIDQAFGLNAQALKLYGQRAETLAANMANADTPGYKARDIDFKSVLQGAMGAGDSAMMRSDARHISPDIDLVTGAARLMYRIPLQPSADGNSVDVQTEQAQFTQNAMRHQASFTFLDGTIKNLISAIRGE